MTFNKIKRRIKQLICLFKYYIVYLFTLIYKKENNIWLLSERGKDARDNGYVFYKYLKNYHPEISIKYVISCKSPDRNRVEEKDIIEFGTFKHYWYYITSPMLISTHYQGYSPNLELFSKLDKMGIIKNKGKKILLDHCVRMGKFGCTKESVKIDMMSCGIKKQYDALLQYSGYAPEVLQLIGLARFDNLFNSLNKPTSNQLLFMPTWRIKYTNITESKFIKSEYFKSCMSFINNKNLSVFLKEKNLRLIFYPHIEMQKFIHLFFTKCDNIEIMSANDAIVEDLLINSKVLITDYSSVFFDFAYLNKPVIYFQFDDDENENMKNKRWFDFKRDGFGPVFKNDEEVVEYIKKMNISVPDAKYIERIKETFDIRDNKNCERNFISIKKLSQDKD